MQLIDYWRRAGKRRWLIIILPLLAMLAVVPQARNVRKTFEARATLEVTQLDQGPIRVRQIVEGFGSVARSDQVVAAAAEAADVDPGRVRAGLGSGQVGSSNLLRIRYRDRNREVADAVLPAVVRATWEQEFERRRLVAETQVEEARADVAEAEAALNAHIAEVGNALFLDEYRRLQNQQQAAEQERAEAEADGDTATVAELDAEIAARQTQIDERTPLVTELRQLEEDERRASQALIRQEERLTEVRAEGSDAAFAAAVDVDEAQAQPTRPRQVRLIAGAGVVATLLTAIGLFMLEIVLPRRDPDDESVEGVDPAPPSGPPAGEERAPEPDLAPPPAEPTPEPDPAPVGGERSEDLAGVSAGAAGPEEPTGGATGAWWRRRTSS